MYNKIMEYNRYEPGSFKFPLTAIKRTDITTVGYKAGLFIINKKKYFLSYHNEEQVVLLRLNNLNLIGE
ncbi:hypothetical protein [Cytobacillus kochii]|uniref:hypothetical protein n=1 Tax=Cytobacillus kochii TaxID=859143 RepID=UPI00203BA04E|nr:hypothetical protein [Cytobacillus kochii]MCM3322405.1 hypothetical protein [Cytobacillus kochii]MCM3345118.1 hypothetical protein [Cytobacillus kochii]MDM5209671.1 hypothetical protein [Cytobacillus kochii]